MTEDYQRLCNTWDRLHAHLVDVDFSMVTRVFIDTIQIGTTDTFAGHHKGSIVVDPRAFKWDEPFKSNYTSNIIAPEDFLTYLLAHEIYHYIYRSRQLDIQHTDLAEEEVAADEFAHKTLKELE